MSSFRLTMIACIVPFCLVACGGDPDERVREELESIRSDWVSAQDIEDLDRRLSAYDKIIVQLDRVSDRYGETEIGARIANGQRALGVEPATYRAVRDDLNSKRDCIAAPTVECLQPFARDPGLNLGVQERDPDIRSARQAACLGDFESVQSALASSRPNSTVYRQKLIQTAFGAEFCERDDLVDLIIGEAVHTDEAVGARRVENLTEILSTFELFAGWSHAADALDTLARSGTLQDDQSASAALTSSLALARLGDVERAYQGYQYVTDQLGFVVNQTDLNELGVALIADGAIDFLDQLEGVTINASNLTIALNVLARDAQLEKEKPFFQGNRRYQRLALNSHSPISEALAPLTAGPNHQVLLQRAELIQSLLDEIRTGRRPAPEYSLSRYGPTYGLLAVIYQKLGEPDKADAVLEIGSEIARDNFADDLRVYAAIIHTAQNDLEAAVAELEAAGRTSGWEVDVPLQVIYALGAAGQFDEGRRAVSRLGSADSVYPNPAYIYLGDGLIKAGQLAEAEQVVAILFASQQGRSAGTEMANRLVEAAAFANDKARLGSLEAYLDGTDQEDRVRFLSAQAKGYSRSGNANETEQILRELFVYGQEADQANNRGAGDFSVSSRERSYFAASASLVAFELGLFDLGLDLYRSATWKDTTPLVKAGETAPDVETLSSVLSTAYRESEQSFAHAAWGGMRGLSRTDAPQSNK